MTKINKSQPTPNYYPQAAATTCHTAVKPPTQAKNHLRQRNKIETIPPNKPSSLTQCPH